MKKIFSILLLLGIGVILFGVFRDYYQITASRFWPEKYNLLWSIGLVGLGVFSLIVLGGIALLLFRPTLFHPLKQAVVSFRERLGLWRYVLVVLLILLPLIILLYSLPGLLLNGAYIRFAIGLAIGWLVAILVTRSQEELVQPNTLVFSLLLFSGLHILAARLTMVTSYPFALFWSEGNRLYDYSVFLGSNRYTYPGKLTIPYDSPGRYLLWGIIFALQQTPIWLHRLWDAILWTGPYILFGFLIARWSKLDRLVKWILALWIFVFLTQGPIYAPLLVSAIIIILTVQKKYLWLSLLGVILASFYASISRWTWAPAPAMWAVLILMAGTETPDFKNWKSILRQFLPIVAVGLVGLVTGYFSNASFFTPEEISANYTFDQPLLWYRLFPNATFPPGILLGTLIAAGPVIVWLIWGAASRWWPINWTQGLVYAVACLATLGVGLVISTKIGGGSNLHNLDMFLITLTVMVGLMLAGRQQIAWKSWPAGMQIVLVLAIILPAWNAFRLGEPLRLPKQNIIAEALDTIQSAVSKAQIDGEVLFMDQRQLLTFGFIKNTLLVPDYEKKYMMDMAMGNNQDYFEAFYADLADKRFSLIVSEPLKLVEKGQIDSFGEENNAWVTWVSNPILCYYEPLITLKQVQVQLLVPKAKPVSCP
jgi:hypothetical protein